MQQSWAGQPKQLSENEATAAQCLFMHVCTSVFLYFIFLYSIFLYICMSVCLYVFLPAFLFLPACKSASKRGHKYEYY